MALSLLYFITEDWFFYSHFIKRAQQASKEGWQVYVITRTNEHVDKITLQGIKIIPIDLVRHETNPLKEIKTILNLMRIIKKLQPDIIHNIALKPIIYGTLASYILNVPFLINAPVGMGYVFTSNKLKARILRPFVTLAYKLLLNPKRSRVIFENPDDLQMMIKMKVVSSKRAMLIRGAGVDINEYKPKKETNGNLRIMIASRMLWDKGIGEFFDAAKQLKKRGSKCRMILVGKSDAENPTAIPEDTLLRWHADGVVEYWGQRKDMPEVFAESNIVILPSYREGLPKVLLEAASCGRAIVATDVPGCREIVRNNENGILVPPRDSQALADAIQYLIDNPEIRKKMGKRGREIVISEFSEEIVVNKTMELYNTIKYQLKRKK